MNRVTQIAWVQCTEVGCVAGLAVDARHVANLTAAGGWLCRDHDGEAVR